jgi:hypothetical protein
MARTRSPKGSKTENKDITSNPVVETLAQETPDKSASQAAPRSETKPRVVAKSDSRMTVVPINLEDEIRRRAYELYAGRGYAQGHETEDWLIAEQEVLQRYRQHTA